MSPARAAAFDILMRVDQQGAYASELLHSEKLAHLSSVDHGLATQITLGVLRWRSALDEDLAHASSKKLAQLDPEVLIALRMAVFQMRYLERIPARAAIFESGELVKRARKTSAAAFVNAVLRKIQPGHQISSIEEALDVAALAMAAAHPVWLVKRWTAHYGFDRARKICVYNQNIPATAIHLYNEGAESELLQEGVQLDRGALLRRARHVISGDVAKSRAFASGAIGVQDEASQLAALLVGSGQKILDCCAAPGGKTRLLVERNPQSQLVATDVHPHRASLLRRLARAGNVRVIAADARQLPLIDSFDRVLADVPCSGTGTLAHNPEIKWRLRPDDLRDLAGRQLAILESALARLSPGGRLVYSTCSLEPEENEAVVEQMLGKTNDFRVASSRDELVRLRDQGELAWEDIDLLVSGEYLRTMPGVHPCDGFFAAIVERRSE